MTTITVHTPSPVRCTPWRRPGRQPDGHVSWRGWKPGTARATPTPRRDQATRIAEAAQTRRYAQQWIDRDPRFAADLLAAADRHDWAE